MEFLNALSKNEKRILAAVGLVGLIVLFFLANDDLFSHFRQTSTEPEVGRIVFVKNDTRHKDVNSVAWGNAKTEEIIRRGDSVFSGQKSSAQVELKKGGVIEIGENSLIVFREMGGDIVGNIDMGSFRIKSEGTLKVAVGGRVTTIEGHQSDIQIIVAKNKKPQVRLISGQAKIKQENNQTLQLVERDVASLDEPVVETKPADLPVALPSEIPAEVEAPKPAEKVVAAPQIPQLADVIYTWHLDDLYLRQGNLISEATPSKTVTLALTTSYLEKDQQCQVELSDEVEFKQAEQASGSEGVIHFAKLFLGVNYWRASYDKTLWSTAQTFNVTSQFLAPQPEIHAALDTVPFIGEVAKLPMEITAKFETTGFVVQSSKNIDFKDSISFWSQNSKFNLSFFEPGDFYYRVRAVNVQQELTDWSSPVLFKVYVPEKIKAPMMSVAQIEVTEGEHVSLNWSQVKQASQYQLEVFDHDHKVIENYQGQDTQMIYQAGEPGLYTTKLTMIDSYGRKSVTPNPTRILVQPKPVIEVIKPLAVAKPVEVKPAAVVAATEPVKEVEHYNDLNRSQVQVEGSLTTIQSSEQVNEGIDPITTGRIGVIVRHWWNKNGIQLSYHSDLAAVQGTGSMAKAFEARYLRSLKIFDNFALHFFVFGGYENYRNSNQAGAYSPGYDVVKLGLTAEAPLFAHSALSAEVSYGVGLSGGSLYELGARYDYFFQKNWSLGLGFRLHFFEAGSAAQAPYGNLPFREGSADSYSLLKYYY